MEEYVEDIDNSENGQQEHNEESGGSTMSDSEGGGEDRQGFDELFHRISMSNSTIDFEYYVKNPFKTVRTVRFCLESQALILYDGRHIPADSILNVTQPPSLMANSGCLVSIRLGSKLKEKKWYFKDTEEASRFQLIASSIKKNGGVLLDAFQQIKGNNKNYLSSTELRKSASKLDIPLSVEQAQAMITLADMENKSYLKYLDFFCYFSSASFIVDLESCILEWKQRLEGNAKGKGRRASVIISSNDEPTPIHLYQAGLMDGEFVLNIIQQTRYFFVPSLAQKPVSPLIGDIYITNYRLNFVSDDTFTGLINTRREVPLAFADVSLPLACISRIDILRNETYSISILSKDLRMCKIRFEANESFTKRFHDVISHQAYISEMRSAFAFSLKESWHDRGWNLYNVSGEFERQGVLQSGRWRLWSDNYSICPTYPAAFILPSAMSNTDILEAAKFRSKGRIPALTWRNPRTEAIMSRCAQPFVGLLGNKSLADKFLLDIYRTRGDVDDQLEVDYPSDFYIVDCRRSIAASANTAMGKGVESVKDYTNTHLIFSDIDNIHVMRGSLRGVEEALSFCGSENSTDDTKFLSKLEDSNWLLHLNKILKASVVVAEKLEVERAGVLIHCSDGWDRTAQLCATAQLLLDPYYRTIEGFCVLIEKEWISFGHKFADRIGHYVNNDSQEKSPVFLQWLDVVRLLLEQFSRRFQFTEQLLIFIMDSVHSCQFGNFLGNCDKDREDMSCKESTKSVWSYVLFHFDSFSNPSYHEYSGPLWPSTCPRKCNLWDRYFYRWIPEMHPRDCSGLSWKNDWGTHLSEKSKKEDNVDAKIEASIPESGIESNSDSDSIATIKTSRVLTL